MGRHALPGVMLRDMHGCVTHNLIRLLFHFCIACNDCKAWTSQPLHKLGVSSGVRTKECVKHFGIEFSYAENGVRSWLKHGRCEGYGEISRHCIGGQ